MMMTSALLVANLFVSLLLVMVVGYMWRISSSSTVVMTYMALYLKDRFPDFGEKHFRELDDDYP